MSSPERQRLDELAQLKHTLKLRRARLQRQRVTNESIDSLLTVIKYLNAVQDGDALRIDGTYSKTAIDKPARNLNCHEEDIMNASLITMRRLIESLLPIPKSTRPRPAETPEYEQRNTPLPTE